MSLAFVFPGQGSQSVGMMSAFAKSSPVIAATFAEASEVLGYDLWQRCQEGPPEALNATECTQPVMLTAGVATYRLWRERGGAVPAAMAGHSLGEFTALVAAGCLDFRVAVDLVRFRAEAMQARCRRAGGQWQRSSVSKTPTCKPPAAKRPTSGWSRPSISMRPARLSLPEPRPRLRGRSKSRPERGRDARCRCRSAFRRTVRSCGPPPNVCVSG